MASSGTTSTFSPVTKALRLLLVRASPSVCSQKATNSRPPSSRPQRSSGARMPRHSGSSTASAMAKRAQMICSASSCPDSSFMVGKVVPQTATTMSRAISPWRSARIR